MTKLLREVNAGEGRKRAATARRVLLWPNATVVYTIGSEYTGKYTHYRYSILYYAV